MAATPPRTAARGARPRADHPRPVRLARQVELLAEVAVFQLRLLVVADLADGHDALLQGEARQDLHHRFSRLLVVRLLAVQPDRAVVPQPELPGAEALPADDGGEVVDVAADVGARLTEPEGRLDAGDDPRPGHQLAGVAGAR